MAADPLQIVRELSSRKSNRLPHEQVWQDCYNFTHPIRGSGFNGQQLDAQQALDKLAFNCVDATATEASRDLTATICGGMIPANSLWFELEMRGIDDEGNTWLGESSRALWSNIHSGSFDSESFECNLDGVVAGWFVQFVDVDKENGGFMFEQWPLASCYVSASKVGGLIDTIYREYTLTAQQAVDYFGADNLPDSVMRAASGTQSQSPVQFIHAIYPRAVWSPDAAFARNMRFASCHVHVDSKRLCKESGFRDFPCIVPRWTRIPGSEYATGPVNDALPTIKRLNYLATLEMAAADVAVSGMWKAVDDGVLNARTLKIGARKVVVMADPDSLQPLSTGANFQVNWTMQDKLQGQIKRILMADALPPADGPAKTAYEYQVRLQMLRQALGPIYGRLQSEWLKQLVELCFNLAYRASEIFWAQGQPGIFNPPPESVRGREFSVKFTSPLARSQKREDIGAMDEYENRLIAKAQVRPSDMDVYDWEEADRERAKLMGLHGSLIRSAEDIQAMRDDREEAQQQEQLKQAIAPGVETASIELGKKAVNG
jgi:hypothetical protein